MTRLIVVIWNRTCNISEVCLCVHACACMYPYIINVKVRSHVWFQNLNPLSKNVTPEVTETVQQQ
jgi:hypothetical protein